MTKGLFLPLLLLLSLNGCANGRLPYDAWFLGFLAPNYMEVWIETADVVDVRERVFKRAMNGISAIQSPTHSRGNPKGWPVTPGGGKGKLVIGADLPRLIYVRWQSLVEPRTYSVYIPISADTREAMVKSEQVLCKADGKWITDYRDMLTIGLAPGGVAKVWLGGQCLPPIEVARIQGEVVKAGPDLGRSEGRYAMPLSPEAQEYVDRFGVPYGSW